MTGNYPPDRFKSITGKKGLDFEMKWSKAELENLALAGADATVERVMKHLSDPENADIFASENFSYLWGILGISGICGADETARSKIWWTLKENGAVDAYDKGVLNDYTRKLSAGLQGNRLRGWMRLNNFQAGEKFRDTILQKLADSGILSKEEIFKYCFDYKKLDERLDKKELDNNLKTYLEQLRRQGDSGSISAVYEKTAVLRKLCTVVAYTRRRLSENEKDYLFRYLREAVEYGFAPENIGLTDKVLTGLMADNILDGKSELDAAPFLTRNLEIEEFAAELEIQQGFFEETAAKFIRRDPTKASSLTRRCLDFVQKNKKPKGIVFTLALLDLNQVKSAVYLLSKLADKGCATEMSGFLHRLLPKATGAETLILDIIKNNLRHLSTDNPTLREYAAQRFLSSVRDFAENGNIRQAADLLKYLAEEGWIAANNSNMIRIFADCANRLIALDEKLTSEFEKPAAKFKLFTYKTDHGIFIGTADENPLTQSRKHFENAFLNATTLDLSAATAKMQGLETAAYGVYRSIKNTLSSTTKKHSQTAPFATNTPHKTMDNLSATVTNNHEEIKSSTDITTETPENKDFSAKENNELTAEIMQKTTELPIINEVKNLKENNLPPKKETLSEPEQLAKDTLPVKLNESLKTTLPENSPCSATEEISAETRKSNLPYETDTKPAANNTETEKMSLTTPLQSGQTTEETTFHAENKSKKINISNILKINSKEIDEHFEKIKEITSTAVRNAEKQAKQIKEKVKNTSLSQKNSISKIHQIAQKINFFRKK